jgi:hypothetical protein
MSMPDPDLPPGIFKAVLMVLHDHQPHSLVNIDAGTAHLFKPEAIKAACESLVHDGEARNVGTFYCLKPNSEPYAEDDADNDIIK